MIHDDNPTCTVSVWYLCVRLLPPMRGRPFRRDDPSSFPVVGGELRKAQSMSLCPCVSVLHSSLHPLVLHYSCPGADLCFFS